MTDDEFIRLHNKLADVYLLSAAGGESTAEDVIMKWITDLARRGRLDLIEALIASLDVEKLTVGLTFCFVLMTYHMKDGLRNHPTFYKKAMRSIAMRLPGIGDNPKHVIATLDTCPCEKQVDHRRCPTCDWGLAVCLLCGAAEIELKEPCKGPPEKPTCE